MNGGVFTRPMIPPQAHPSRAYSPTDQASKRAFPNKTSSLSLRNPVDSKVVGVYHRALSRNFSEYYWDRKCQGSLARSRGTGPAGAKLIGVEKEMVIDT